MHPILIAAALLFAAPHEVVDLGWFDVQPDTTYRAAYDVTSEGGASLYMIVREHPAREVKPHPNYHKTSVHHRALPAGDTQTRKLTFTTRPDTAALSVSIVILQSAGDVKLSPFKLTDVDVDAEAKAEHAALMAEINAAADARQRVLPRTLVFSRAQMKYGLERNYEHVWTDRPLLVNRAYRVPRKYVTPFPSYQRILEEVAQYRIDGLAFFPETRDRVGMFELTDRAAVPGIRLLPEFIPTDKVEPKLELLEQALKHETTVRIDGKVLITSYVAQALEPAQWADILAQLRAAHGDSFIFLPALTNVVSLRQYHAHGKPVPREKVEEAQAYLRSYLDVADGIYFNYAAALKNEDRTFDEAFYRELFIPVFKSVLSEPKYRDKLLGLSAYHSHSNPDLSIGLLEDGTRTVRDSFEAAMDAEPDVIVLPEWDEVNENTCFRPTTCNSTTTQRIMRHYMSQIRGEKPTPLHDDDTSVANLILSTRKIVTLGEKLIIELLNVPDGETGSYTAQLALEDETGRVVRTFEPVTFDKAALQEQRYELATEDFAAARALLPVLTVDGRTYRDGLPHTQLRATWNWDYKFVKQPLRELVDVKRAALALRDGKLVGDVEAGEDLALVEVIADGDLMYAVHDGSEPLSATATRETFRIEYRSTRTQQVSGKVTVRGARPHWTYNLPHLHQREMARTLHNPTLQLDGDVSPHLRWSCFTVPRSGIDGGSVEVRLGDVHLDVSLREVLDKGMIAGAGENGLHVAVFPYRRMLDMPYHLDAQRAAFEVPVWPWIATEQYHLRLTSKTGRTWRSRPVVLPLDDAATTLRVFSDVYGKAVDVEVGAARVPDVRYAFDPSRGAVLLTDAGKPFWASLGGFPDTTSGRGGRHSASMYQGDRNGYPSNATQTAPQWVSDHGEAALAFDGVGTFMHLPRETLPRRGAFTVTFDIKPQAAKDQYLLLHRAHRPASLIVSIRDGNLHATYFAEGHALHTFETDLAVPVDEWSQVRVSRDFQTLRLSVNDRTHEAPLVEPGFDIGPIVFGGFGATGARFDEQAGNPGWFKGLMRGLRVVHDAR